VAGSIGDVKDAIARVNNPSMLPGSVSTQVKELSTTEDAWGLTTVPLSNLGMYASKNSPVPLGNGMQNSLGSVQSMSGGVKFGPNVTLNVQLVSDTAQNATALAGVIQFFANMAQLNAAKNPQAAAALQALTATASGPNVNVSLSLKDEQFRKLLQPEADMAHPRRNLKK
jgi:hypothetical protein